MLVIDDMLMVLVASDYDRPSSRWSSDRHSRHTENGFADRDDDDEENVNMQVKGQDEIPRRSASPVLRPLPSTSNTPS